MFLALLVIGAILIVYFMGWIALLLALLAGIAFFVYSWIADAQSLRSKAKVEGKPVGSLFSFLGPAMRLAKMQHEQSKNSLPPLAAIRKPVTQDVGSFQFLYVDRNGAQGKRTVDVQRVSERDGFTYLEGYCHTRNAERTFRTDRIRGSLKDMETGELIPIKRLLSTVHERTSMTYRPEGS